MNAPLVVIVMGSAPRYTFGMPLSLVAANKS
jgi:hypothetical protein